MTEKELAVEIARIVIGIARNERDRALRMGDIESARDWNSEIARQNSCISANCG